MSIRMGTGQSVTIAATLFLPALFCLHLNASTTRQSPTQPSTQPIVTYDKFDDRTTVTAALRNFAIGFTYAGRQQKEPNSDFAFFIRASRVDRPEAVTFLIGDQIRTRVGSGAVVQVNWLQQLVDARTVEFAIMGSTGREEGTLDDADREAIKRILEVARQSPAAIAERRKAAEEAAAAAIQAERERLERQERQELLALGVRPEGGTIIFILDCSGSMLNKLPAAKAMLSKAVNRAANDQAINVIALVEDLPSAAPAPLQNSPESQDTIYRFVSKLSAVGSAPSLETAFSKALAHKPTVIVLLTDGDFESEQIARTRKKLNETATRVNVVLFLDGAEVDQSLIQLSRNSKGQSAAYTPDGSFEILTPSQK